MDKQKAFDIAVGGIIAQGERAYIEGHGCRLRVENDGKICKCAIGQFIDDADYSPCFENHGALTRERKDVLGKPFYDSIVEKIGPVETDEDADFLDDLQTAHDIPEDFEGMIENYRALAVTYNLSTEVLKVV